MEKTFTETFGEFVTQPKRIKEAVKTIMSTDVYKVGHKNLYEPGITTVFSNFTPRSGNWANPDLGFVKAHGMRYVVHKLIEDWNENFFSLNIQELEVVLRMYKMKVKKIIGIDIDLTHFEELHELGHLPLDFRAVKEGSSITYKKPILTVHNTDERFAWLVNYLETKISAELWPIVTASTKAFGIKQQLDRFNEMTGAPIGYSELQAHDFSYRGMEGTHGALLVGMGHLNYFLGSDNLPAILETGKGVSVLATEHSIMSAGTKEKEFETYERLIEDNPTGVLSIVSDTWNIYNVCNNILPELKEKIMKRDGVFVVRPDSGDPIEVLLGGAKLTHPDTTWKDIELAEMGLFEIIKRKFGYIVNEAGYIELPIGFLWGDGMTPEKIEEVYSALAKAGYSSSCLSIGVGSYAYQLNTRDTYGFAMKATYIEKGDKSFNISKDPITDSGVKKSATGLLAIIDGELIENSTWEVVNSDKNELEKING